MRTGPGPRRLSLRATARRFAAPLAVVMAAASVTSCGSEVGGSSEPRTVDSEVRLVDGGAPAFRTRLQAERGTPVVVNQWASWCGPCQFEIRFFTRLATTRSGRTTFLGVNSKDSRESATKFLQRNGVKFDNFFDPRGDVSRVFRGGRAMPATAFYSATGELRFTHLGAYDSQQSLAADIERYAEDD